MNIQYILYRSNGPKLDRLEDIKKVECILCQKK